NSPIHELTDSPIHDFINATYPPVSLNYLATRFQCSWPWTTLVMLCDGRVVCGCADPYGQRVLGDARAASLRQIWTGPVIATLRADLNAGGSRFCGDCALKLPL